jgi:ribokinase
LSAVNVPLHRLEAAAQAMRLGKAHGVRTILNPAPAQPLNPAIFADIDYLTPNETELRILLGLAPDDITPTLALAHRLRELGVGNLIVTRGSHGALVLSADGVQEIPGVAVAVVDSTGAGDAFNAGLAVALAEGQSLADAVRYANCAGALACTRLGVIPALAHRAGLDRFFAKSYPQ